MQVRGTIPAVAAAEVLSQLDCGEVLAKACDEIGREEDTSMLAPSTHRDERHLEVDHLAQRPAGAGLSRVAIARAHFVGLLH